MMLVEGMSLSEKLGMAVGSRAHLEAEAIAHRSWHRNLLMHGFHFVVLLVAGGAVKDTQCGFKVSVEACARYPVVNASTRCGTGHEASILMYWKCFSRCSNGVRLLLEFKTSS